jgi:hypothetical protein
MIITSVETFPLRIPFQSGNRSAASAWGPEGWGESVGFTGVPVTQRAIDG